MRFVFLIVFGLTSYYALGQKGERCLSTIQNHEKMMEDNPEYKKHILQWEKKIDPIIRARRASKSPDCIHGPLRVPLAIHFAPGLVPAAQEACVITLAEDHIAELNREMSGLDIDAAMISKFSACFGADILGNSCIEFCIANKNHPSGSGLSNGELAITFGLLDFSIPSGNFTPVNPAWADYVNIYVDDLGASLLGVSNGIPGNFNGDGVLVTSCVFGTGDINCNNVKTTGSTGCFALYNSGETLAHEIGHYFGLRHIWGDNTICTGPQDHIADTPDMAHNYSGYSACNDNNCNELPETCMSSDMYMNFMSYASDGCMYMFTSDQSDLMYATAIAEGYTTSSTKCISDPIAAFTPVGNIDVCDLDGIQYNDLSTEFLTSWSWTFNVVNGDIILDIAVSTIQNPIVHVISGTSGTITTQLIAANAMGNDTITNDQSVIVIPSMTYYTDVDGDGFGNPNDTLLACVIPMGFVTDNTDCDDSDNTSYPGAPEICDGIDNNCDGVIDEYVTTVYYADVDGDGFGNPSDTLTACVIPMGFAMDNTDCDDTDNTLFPGAPELCDGIDNNCDGVIDEGCCNGSYLIINTITNLTHRAEINISSNAIIDSSGHSVLFTAGSDIDLIYPFEVAVGTSFEARIESCNPSFQDNNLSEQKILFRHHAIDEMIKGMDSDHASEIKISDIKGRFLTCSNIEWETSRSIIDQLISKFTPLSSGVYKLEILIGNKIYVEDILLIK
jgi:PKD repeat protein